MGQKMGQRAGEQLRRLFCVSRTLRFPQVGMSLDPPSLLFMPSHRCVPRDALADSQSLALLERGSMVDMRDTKGCVTMEKATRPTLHMAWHGTAWTRWRGLFQGVSKAEVGWAESFHIETTRPRVWGVGVLRQSASLIGQGNMAIGPR
ncbi:hypothetical protein VDGL01_05278 [Verticillium dahliae]